MTIMRIKILLLLLFVLTTALASQALPEVRVPSIIGDNMVLQQDKKVRIWGWASPNEKVNCRVGEAEGQRSCGCQGHWQA